MSGKDWSGTLHPAPSRGEEARPRQGAVMAAVLVAHAPRPGADLATAGATHIRHPDGGNPLP